MFSFLITGKGTMLLAGTRHLDANAFDAVSHRCSKSKDGSRNDKALSYVKL